MGRQDGRELAALKGHTGTVTSVAFSPDGARILTGSLDNTARLWDAKTARSWPPSKAMRALSEAWPSARMARAS